MLKPFYVCPLCKRYDSVTVQPRPGEITYECGSCGVTQTVPTGEKPIEKYEAFSTTYDAPPEVDEVREKFKNLMGRKIDIAEYISSEPLGKHNANLEPADLDDPTVEVIT